MNLLPYTAGRVFNTPLMVSRAKLDTILNIVVPRMDGEKLPIAALPEKHEYGISKDGIAVIPVIGTLVRRTVGLEAQSGLTSYVGLEAQLDAALNDNSIKGILLDIDSPGGESGGVFDFADKVYAASRIKPIYAAVNEDAFSAAYIIAAAAQRIFIPRTGGAGSIGVIAVHLDESKSEAKAGLTYTAIYAGARKNDLSPHEPLSDPARANLQTEVDRIYGIFAQTIADYRGLDAEFIKSTEAALFFGKKAVDVGLADEEGTFDDALNALAEKIHDPDVTRKITKYPEDIDDDDIMAELFCALDEEDSPRVREYGRAFIHPTPKSKEQKMAKTEKDYDEKDDATARRSKRAKHRAEEQENEEEKDLEAEDGDDEKEDKPASRRRAEKEDEDDKSHLEAEESEEEEEPTSRKSKKAKGRKAETDEEEDEDAYLELDDEEEEEASASRRSTRRKAMTRKAKRNKAFAYLAAVNELCLLAGRPDRASAFIAKAVPLATIRKVLLNARAAQDEATAIMGYAAPRTTPAKDEPKIDTAAIYESRNNMKRSKN